MKGCSLSVTHCGKSIISLKPQPRRESTVFSTFICSEDCSFCNEGNWRSIESAMMLQRINFSAKKAEQREV